MSNHPLWYYLLLLSPDVVLAEKPHTVCQKDLNLPSCCAAQMPLVTSRMKKHRLYISSVYCPFSDRFGLPLHNFPSSGLLMKSIGADFLRPYALPGVKPHGLDAVSNSYKYCIVSGTQLIQLYRFMCTIPTQNININLHTKHSFSRLLPHTWVKAVMQF